MQWTKTGLAVASLAALTLGCKDVMGSHGAFRYVASRTVTGGHVAALANEPLPIRIPAGGEWTFEGPFDDPPEKVEVPIKRLRTTAAQFRFDTSLDLEAKVDVIMSSGNRRCVIAKNMHARERGVAPVHWSPPCTDIFFSPDRVVSVRVVSTSGKRIVVRRKDAVTVSVQAVFNFK